MFKLMDALMWWLEKPFLPWLDRKIRKHAEKNGKVRM